MLKDIGIEMSNSIYTIRNYRPSDFENYVRLHTEAEKLEPTGHYPSSQILSERLRRPGYSPEQDLFIAETVGNMVGCMEVTPEFSVGRVILNCLIHPDHRRQGLSSGLLDYATHRAQELEIKVIHVNIPQDNVIAKRVLSKLGFRFVRRFLQLRLDMAKARGQETDQAALQYRHLQRGEEDKLTQLQNRSFAGTWGYNPNTVAEITHFLNNCSPEDIVLACDGDKAIGYCWTRLINEADAATTESKGQIFMLGVDPDYRGRGIGKKVLLAGLSYLQSKGIQVAELTVDSRNKAACSLYRSIGFTVQTSSLWYQKLIG